MNVRILLSLLLACLPALAQGQQGITDHPQQQAEQRPISPRGQERLQAEVAHQLNMLPTYSIFDVLNYQIQGSTVILSGKVRTLGLKTAAEDAVRKVEGVDRVQNDIEVLAPSSSDDRLRVEVARVLFNTPALMPYSMGAVPPIHIIVEGGKVTLEGIVNSQADKDLAGLKTSSIPGIFSVTNDLRVEK